MSNYFKVLSDDWVQPNKEVYVPPSKRKNDVKQDIIKDDDFPDFGLCPKPRKNVLKMSSSCFVKASVEENKKTIDEEFEEIKDDWYFCVLTPKGPVKHFTQEHKKEFVETAKRYIEYENNIPELINYSNECEEYDDYDKYSESESEYDVENFEDILSVKDMRKYVAKVEVLKKKKYHTNYENKAFSEMMMNVLIAKDIKSSGLL